MKKILFYVHFLKIGGIEKVLLIYLKNLQAFGYEVELLVDYDLGEKNILREELPENMNIFFVKNKFMSKIIVNLRELSKKYKILNLLLLPIIFLSDFFFYHFKVKKLFREKNYDISITFYQLLPSFLTKNKNCKHIIYNHGNLENYFLGFKKIFKEAFGRKLNNYDYIIAICDEMKEQIEKFYPEIDKAKIRRFYNPFDFNKIRKEGEKEKISASYLVTVLRIDESDKDLKTLLLAFAQLDCKEKLYIVGDGNDKEYFENFVKERKLQDRIIFLGMQKNPYIYIKNANFLVHSSKSEGLSTVLIETLALNKYILCSKCKTGIKEILKNEELGDVFEIGNVKELAEKISFALENPEYLQEKISKQEASLYRFDEKNVMTKFKEFLEEL